MRALKIGSGGAGSGAVASAPLETFEDVQLAQAIESVRRSRVETRQAEEVLKEYGFRRIVLVVVLSILALVAIGSVVVAVAGMIAGIYSLTASAVVPLSGTGGLSVLTWRTYTGNPPGKTVESWTQGGESLGAGSKPS